MQHPLEPAIQVKVQTKSDNPGPVQAIDGALGTLEKELEIFERRFKHELERAGKEGLAPRGGAGAAGDAYDPMVLG